MPPFSAKSFSERTSQAVKALESVADTEVVVAVAPRSGSYADVDLGWGIVLALVGLVVIIHGPWVFAPDLLVVNAAFSGLVGWALSRWLPWPRRWLTTSLRRHKQVHQAAQAYFMERGLSHTRERRAALIYLSLLERRAEVLVDVGLEGMVPGAVFNQTRHGLQGCASLEDLEKAFFAELDRLRQALPGFIPARPEQPDQWPNEPEMLPA